MRRGLELVEAEKSCSTGEAHLSVLRRIAEKLSSDALAQDGDIRIWRDTVGHVRENGCEVDPVYYRETIQGGDPLMAI